MAPPAGMPQQAPVGGTGTYQGLTPDGVEMVVVNWKGAAGKHPVLGRNSFNIIVTDKRVLVAKAGLMTRLGKGMALGGAMGGALGGIATAAAGGVIAGLGSVLNRADWPDINEKRQTASAEVDELATKSEMLQVANQAIPQVRLKKGMLTCKITFVLPEGEFTAEFGGFKDTMKAFSQIFPGRIIQQ